MKEQIVVAESWSNRIMDFAMDYGPKAIGALLVFWIGSMVIGMLSRMFNKVLMKRGVEPTLQRFLGSLVSVGLRVLLFITVIGMLGVQTTSFIAILGAAGLAIGLALQGTLANFAGGTLILLFKPYKVGDLIEAQGALGHVKEIQIFTTTLLTPENKLTIVPNGVMANGTIVNYTAEGKIRVDLTVRISYSSNIATAKQALIKVMHDQPLVFKDPAPFVGVVNLNESSIDLAVRPHCAPEHYWDVYFTTLESCKVALDEAGISIPFPQRDVHMVPVK